MTPTEASALTAALCQRARGAVLVIDDADRAADLAQALVAGGLCPRWK